MNNIPSLTRSRPIVFVLSLILLFTVIQLIFTLIENRPVPQHRTAPEVVAPRVHTIEVLRGSYPILVQTFGTVKAEKTVTLNAPFAGRVTAAPNLVPGRDSIAEQVLFRMETTKLESAIGQLKAQLNSLQLEKRRLSEQISFFNKRIKVAKDLVRSRQESVNQSKQTLAIQQEIYEKNKALYLEKAISRTEFLQVDLQVNNAELSLINSRAEVDNNLERLNFLEQQVSADQVALDDIANQQRQLALQVYEQLNDLDKSQVKLAFPSRIIEVFVDQEQEVSAGTALASVRSTNAVEIVVNLPDTHFRWLYEGDLLNRDPKEKETPVSITLVNQGFRKQFSGGKIKSIGESVNEPTRSLPFVIGRENPQTELGLPVGSDELKPGMYCEVELSLGQLDEVFLVPPQSLQEENRLFAVETDESRLRVVDDFEVLHEGREGLLIKIPGATSPLTLLSHKLNQGTDGMRVTLIQEEGL